MATYGSVAPSVVDIQEDVHVTGRSILATIVDALVFGVLYAVMTMLFGTVSSVGPANWSGSLPALASVRKRGRARELFGLGYGRAKDRAEGS